MRFEYKYFVSNELESQLNAFCSNNGILDSNCFYDSGYKIQSIYKYTWKTDNIHGKIRLRKYSTSNGNNFYIEEKVNIEGSVTKTRMQIEEQMYASLFHCANATVFFLLLHELKFKLNPNNRFDGEFATYIVYYYRTPWKIQYKGNEYRLTIDKKVSTLVGEHLVNIVDDDTMIFEIKGTSEAGNLMHYMKQQFHIYPERISKHKMAKRLTETEYEPANIDCAIAQ